MSATLNGVTAQPEIPFLEHVAQTVLSRHPPSELRGVTILLPNYHVAQPLAQALMRQAGGHALLLPAMVTLNDWAQSIPLQEALLPESRRIVVLYQALKVRQWFGAVDYWGLAQELLALFDELTASLATLPHSAEAFAEVLQAAYQARQNVALQFEARLVHELWYAMQQGEGLDAMRAYQQRLAGLAAGADSPLFVLRTCESTPLEQHFLTEYSRNASVTIVDCRDWVATQPESALLLAALRPSDAQQAFSLCQQSERLRADFPRAHLAHRLHFFGADSLEHEARAAVMQVRCWLHEGRRAIALVAQDRAVARRVRALLERVQVGVSDETGWTFSTLSVSSVLMGWLDTLQGDFYHQDFLALLKSPYVLADLPAAERKAMVYRLEQRLRKKGIVAHLDEWLTLTADAAELTALLRRFQQAAALIPTSKRHSLAGWLAALLQSIQVLAIDAGWQQDEAGEQLFRALKTWQDELSGDATRLSFSEWRRWLAQRLDTLTYRDRSVESPVRFTHLAATRGRSFEGVIVLGADDAHLPALGGGRRWFNDAVRGSLHLPTLADSAAQQRDDLLALLATNSRVLITWQRHREGEEGLLSPYLEMLRDLHRQSYDDDLSERTLADWLALETQSAAGLPESTPPAPVVESARLPGKISISGYNSLVACPYQYYARHVLRLNEMDEVGEALEKRDYGELVHEILRRFHATYPVLSERDAPEFEQALRQLSSDVFSGLIEHDFLARAWLARWLKALPAYLVWQRETEADGWRYGEAETTIALPLDGILLQGRIDRLDRRGESKRVLDYKLQAAGVLREKLREAGEDVQLACYAAAHQAEFADFVSIEGGEVKTICPEQTVEELARLNLERLALIVRQLREGAPFPANGIEGVCAHCEMCGVCRKTEWSDG